MEEGRSLSTSMQKSIRITVARKSENTLCLSVIIIWLLLTKLAFRAILPATLPLTSFQNLKSHWSWCTASKRFQKQLSKSIRQNLDPYVHRNIQSQNTERGAEQCLLMDVFKQRLVTCQETAGPLANTPGDSALLLKC